MKKPKGESYGMTKEAEVWQKKKDGYNFIQPSLCSVLLGFLTMIWGMVYMFIFRKELNREI